MLIYHLALHHAPKLGSQFYHAIIDCLDASETNLENLFSSPSILRDILSSHKKTNDKHKTKISSCFNKVITETKIKHLEDHINNIDWSIYEKALLWQETPQNNIITSSDIAYPGLLKQIYNKPPILYTIGDTSLLQSMQLAIVGSRNPTPTGQQSAYDFAQHLSQSGLVITSGMALGIDAASHHACLDSQNKTIAVTGTGLDRIYPASHKELAHKIAEQGLLVSEFALGTGPNKANFPRRNQIISGLSLGTLVIEAALKSGSLITAHAALEQGREVFAIPGSIHNPLARGCHQLIKQGAKLVENAQDIIDEISPLLLAGATINQENIIKARAEKSLKFKQDRSNKTEVNLPKKTKPIPKKSVITSTPAKKTETDLSNEKMIISFIDYEPTTIDQLFQRSQIPIAEINSQLLLLELDNLIQVQSDGKVMLCPKN